LNTNYVFFKTTLKHRFSYWAFHRFGQAKLAFSHTLFQWFGNAKHGFGGLVLGLSQFPTSAQVASKDKTRFKYEQK